MEAEHQERVHAYFESQAATWEDRYSHDAAVRDLVQRSRVPERSGRRGRRHGPSPQARRLGVLHRARSTPPQAGAGTTSAIDPGPGADALAGEADARAELRALPRALGYAASPGS